MTPVTPRYILSLSCPDRVGVVAAVSGLLASMNGWIVEANHHADPTTGTFFMRQEVLAESVPFGVDELGDRFLPIVDEFDMTLNIRDTSEPEPVAVFVSKHVHCLVDLLYRWQTGELSFDLKAVVSNHPDLRSLVEWYGVPFIHVPVDRENKTPAFEQMTSICEEHGVRTIVLARYMQILPPTMCRDYPNRVLNIHHSFLPSFIGARPYHQAFDRGVKLVGATCHYVTEELDAGPIIEQDVVRVDHADAAADMVRLGKDVERTVLMRGLRYHLEDRVLVQGNKTVVFR